MKEQKRPVLPLLIGCVACCLSLFAGLNYLSQYRTAVLLGAMMDRLSLLCWALFILLAALSVGCAFLRLVRLTPALPGAALLFGQGLGLALVALLVMIMGLLGLASKTRLVLMLCLLLFSGLYELARLARRLLPRLARVRRLSAFRIFLWLTLGFFLILNLTRSFEPPWEYDCLEYHLAAPAAWDRAGRIFFIHDNAYANFPQNVEMLHFLGMRLTGSPDLGAIVGQLIGAACALFAALALRGMLSRIAGKETADIAAAIFYVWPGVTIYSGVAYVELPLLFHATLCIWALVWVRRRPLTRPGARGWVALAGLAGGVALGVKYTAALVVLAPVGLWLVAIGILSRVRRGEIARRVAIFACLALLAAGPWFIRNAINTRNPVYPLLYKVFDGSNWSARKDARWTQAHAPRDLSLHNMAAEARDMLLDDEHRTSLILYVFIPLCLLAPRRVRGLALLLALHVVVVFLLWFYFTQHNDRFLEIIIPILAALSALGLGAVLRLRFAGGLRPLFIMLLLFEPARMVNYVNAQRSLGVALGAVSQDAYFAGLADIDFRLGYRAMQFINDEKNVPPGSKVLFLGEARTFYCRRECVASTVFDTNLLEEIVGAARSPDEIVDALKARGITHLYVDTAELLRLQESYRYTFDGRERLGMLDLFNWPLFARFARARLAPVVTFAGSGAEDFPWARWEELFVTPRLAGRPVSGHILALYAIR